MSLIISNGVLAFLIAIMPLEQCEVEAKRLNNDIYYSELIAFCEVTTWKQQ